MSVMKWLRYLLVAILAVGVLISSIAFSENNQRVKMLEAESRLVETRHGATEYAVWGEGPPVLAVHSAGGGLDQGRLLAEVFGGTALCGSQSHASDTCAVN